MRQMAHVLAAHHSIVTIDEGKLTAFEEIAQAMIVETQKRCLRAWRTTGTDERRPQAQRHSVSFAWPSGERPDPELTLTSRNVGGSRWSTNSRCSRSRRCLPSPADKGRMRCCVAKALYSSTLSQWRRQRLGRDAVTRKLKSNSATSQYPRA